MAANDLLLLMIGPLVTTNNQRQQAAGGETLSQEECIEKSKVKFLVRIRKIN